MEKDQKVLIGLITFILLVVIGIGVFLFITKKSDSSDAIKFKNEYESLNEKTNDASKEKNLSVDIEENNLYIYKTDEEVLDILKNKSGLIFFGFAKCPYCRSMVSILNDVAKEQGLNEIYYLDILNIRDSYEVLDHTVVKTNNGTNAYYEILGRLSEYLTDYYIKDSDDIEYSTGVKRLYAPTVVAVDNGRIVGFHEGTLDEVEYNKELDEEQQKELKEILESIISQLTSDVCESSNC